MLFTLVRMALNIVPSRCLSKTFAERISNFVFSSNTVLPGMVAVARISDNFSGNS